MDPESEWSDEEDESSDDESDTVEHSEQKFFAIVAVISNCRCSILNTGSETDTM